MAAPSDPRDDAPPRRASGERLAYALMLISPAMFATNMLVARATVEIFPPVALSFWRWTATLALMALVLRRSLWTSRTVARAEWRQLLVLGAIGMGICGAFVYIGAQTTTATNLGLIYAAAPVLIILLGRILFGERLTIVQGIGVAMSLAGVLVVILKGSPAALLGLRFTVGDLWTVAAATGWGFYTVLLKHWPTQLGFNLRFAWIIVGGLAAMLPFTIAEGILVGTPALTPATLAWIAILATVASTGAFQTYGLVQRILGPARAGLILYVIPLYTAALAYAFLGERLALHHVLGAALVLPGIFLATRRPAGA
ncbi:MAG: DMT family transporter [Alphaproteobacteria bacterium]|nr:DMT family transporter [Alphaproteobacteria bacterium]